MLVDHDYDYSSYECTILVNNQAIYQHDDSPLTNRLTNYGFITSVPKIELNAINIGERKQYEPGCWYTSKTNQ